MSEFKDVFDGQTKNVYNGISLAVGYLCMIGLCVRAKVVKYNQCHVFPRLSLFPGIFSAFHSSFLCHRVQIKGFELEGIEGKGGMEMD